MHKYKGRWCYQAPKAKAYSREDDSCGAVALYQDLDSKPTTVVASNINVWWGCQPGNKTTSADAVRAYVQALLKSKHRTFVKLPPDLWPDEWRGKFTNPVCLLVRALYGHPEAGAHWEQHLTAILKELGGAPVATHPSTFWFADRRLLLTVYVDDLMLSGPEAEHTTFWDSLIQKVKLDPPETLDRFLGRHHQYGTIKPSGDCNVIKFFEPTPKEAEPVEGGEEKAQAGRSQFAEGMRS